MPAKKEIIKDCQFCNKKFLTSQYYLNLGKGKFCSPICFTESTKKRIEIKCFYCKKIINRPPSFLNKSKSGRHFCNHECDSKYRSEYIFTKIHHVNYKDGSGSYREKALKLHNFKCMNSDCLLKEIDLPKEAFEVDHIDSNRKNNNIENLQVLCAICHRIKTTKDLKQRFK